MTKGLHLPNGGFHAFAQGRPSAGVAIATRERVGLMGQVGYLPNPDPVLKRLGMDVAAYRDLLSDASVGAAVRRRKAAVVAMEHGLDRGRAKSRVAAAVEAMLARVSIPRLQAQAVNGALFGYAPFEIMWGQQQDGLLAPVAVEAKPPEWFVFGEAGDLRLRTLSQPLRGEELPPHKFICVRQDPDYLNPYGFPELSRVYWPTTFKRAGWRWWAEFTEKYGSSFIFGKLPRSASDEERTSLADQLEAMVRDAVAVIPDDGSVELPDNKGKGHSVEAHERLIRACRSEINTALLGQDQSTEANANLASAKAATEVTQDIRDADASLAVDLLAGVIDAICAVNWGDVERPVWSLWEQEQVDETLAKRDETLVKAGARLTRSYFMRAYSLQEGDLAPDTDAPAAPGARGAEFSAPSGWPDQEALDEALAGLAEDVLSAQAGEVLRPVLAALAGARGYDDALRVLQSAYADMPSAALEERLTQLSFAADLAGRLQADDEILRG